MLIPARALLLLLMNAPPEERGQLTGVIADGSQAVVPMASLVVVNDETGIRRSARSNDLGTYVVASLPAGVYKVTVRRPGFQTMTRLNVRVTAGAESRVDFALTLGNMRDTITVDGDPPTLHPRDASVGLLASRNLIENLPLNGRGLLGLIDLTPGIVTTPATGGEAGQFSANGLRANTNYFTVDGVSANTGVAGSGLPAQFAGGTLPGMTAFGSAQSLVSLHTVQEVRIQTSTFAPEFGRMPGAQVAVLTRSGADEFHGLTQVNFRNEALDANDWLAKSLGFPRARSRLWQGAASGGGPVVPLRTYFFASAEALRFTQPLTWRIAVPSDQARIGSPSRLRPLLDAFPRSGPRQFSDLLAEAAGQTSPPNSLTAWSLKLDHSFNPRFTGFARFHHAPSTAQFGVITVNQTRFESSAFTGGFGAALTPSWTNDFRANFTFSSANSEWRPATGGGQALNLATFFPATFVSPVPEANWYAIGIGGLGELISGVGGRNQQGQLNLLNTVAQTGARHAARFGADYQRLTPLRPEAAVSVAGFYRSLPQLLSGAPLLTSSNTADQASSRIETLSFFAQDTWRVHGRVTLTYGLRWELSPAPALRSTASVSPANSFSPGSVTPGGGVPSTLAPTGLPLWPTRYGQFAPRIGIAFQADERRVLRAGWGLFYDLGFSAATDPINGFPFNRWQVSSGLGVATLGAAPSRASGYARDLKLPYAHHWNVSFEQALTRNDVVSAAYLGSAGRLLLRREGTLEPGTPFAGSVVATNNGASDYHALEVQYRRRLARGLEGTASYTWSHAIDNGSWDGALFVTEPASNDRASSSYDARHGFSAALSYRWRNWAVHGIGRARSAFPIDILTTRNVLGLGFDNVTRPDVAAGVPLRDGQGRLNPRAFRVPPLNRQGTLGRNALRGNGLSQIDLAVDRTLLRRERLSLETRLQVFNALNQVNFADPVRHLDSPYFGQPASLANRMLGSGNAHSGLAPAFQIGGPRTLECSLRIRF